MLQFIDKLPLEVNTEVNQLNLQEQLAKLVLQKIDKLPLEVNTEVNQLNLQEKLAKVLPLDMVQLIVNSLYQHISGQKYIKGMASGRQTNFVSGEACVCECGSLCNVIYFSGSSMLERICAEAFYGTSIESLYVPDGVHHTCQL